MNKQSCDSLKGHSSSSIALLQERFRQLQRAKEMREGRELWKQLTEPDCDNSSTCQDPSRVLFQSELIHPLRLPLQGSHPSNHQSQSKQASLSAAVTPRDVHPGLPEPTLPDTRSFRVGDTRIFSGSLQYMEAVKYRSSSSFQDSDIDTSLHL